MASTKSTNQTVLIVLLLSLLACNIPVQSRRAGIHVTGSCSTPDACTKTQSDLEGVLEPCLGDAQGSSTPTPGDSCCTGIVSLDPSCLCKALTLALSYPILNINTTDALAMPKECGYKVPKHCVCDGHIVPNVAAAN